MLLDRGSVRVVGRRQQRLDLHETVQAGALRVGEVVETFGVQHRLALGGRKLAQATEGAGDVAALVGRKVGELPHRGAHLFALWRGKVFGPLIAFEKAIPLFRWHGIELREPLAETLLRLRWEIAEAGQAL